MLAHTFLWNNMISGATQSSFLFLLDHYKQQRNVRIHYNPHELLNLGGDIKILWAHYSYDQPLMQNVIWSKIDHVVCVSEWQRNCYIKHFKLPEQKVSVIRNGGAEYYNYDGRKKSKTLIYASTPFRGLEYIPYVFSRVLEKHPDAHLKVFSGMNLYGSDDDPHHRLYEELKELKNTTYSPAIPHKELAEHMKEAAFFAYPNTWEETSCVTLIEAMRTGCYPVISNLGALPETSCGYGTIVDFKGKWMPEGLDLSVESLNEYAETLIAELDNFDTNTYYNRIKEMSDYACNKYDWKIIADEWKTLTDKLIARKEKMTENNYISDLVHKSSDEIVSDTQAMQRVYDEVFKWEESDKELAQSRTNFQIEKFILMDNFTIPSAYVSMLKNRRVMAEGLMQKITQMKEAQREFDYKWKDKDLTQPINWPPTPEGKLCWHDLDALNLSSQLKSGEIEVRDRVQQIEFFDKILNKLIELNGGPITREQYEKEDHIYWERRFANQAYDDMVSRRTGISAGDLHSIRRASAPTLVSDDVNRIKNPFPSLDAALSNDGVGYMLGIQEKVLEGVAAIAGDDFLLQLRQEQAAAAQQLQHNPSQNLQPSPKTILQHAQKIGSDKA